jgi:hypothetical protein
MLVRHRAGLAKQRWSLDMRRALWELLLEDPSDLTCGECFAVLEYYAEVLAGPGSDLLPRIIEHLERCPDCALQHQEELQYLLADPSEGDATTSIGTPGGVGSRPRANSPSGSGEESPGEE